MTTHRQIPRSIDGKIIERRRRFPERSTGVAVTALGKKMQHLLKKPEAVTDYLSAAPMNQEIYSFIRLPFQGSASRKKPTFTYDAAWGRPVFRAPELASPQVSFDPLPFRFLAAARPSGPVGKR